MKDRDDLPLYTPAIPNSNGAPWYVRPLLYFLTYVGLPGVMALFLLLMFSGWIPSPILSTAAGVAELKTLLDTHAVATKEINEALKIDTKLLRAICRNTAKTDYDRVACDL